MALKLMLLGLKLPLEYLLLLKNYLDTLHSDQNHPLGIERSKNINDYYNEVLKVNM